MKDFLQRWLTRRVAPEAALDAPAPEAAPDLAPEPLDWKAELAFELGLASGPPPAARPVAEAQPSERKQYSSAAGFRPEMVPRDFAGYRSLMHRQFDPAKGRLALAMTREPRFRSAFAVWRPGALETNLNVLHEVYDRLAKLMGEIYRFHPAPLGYDPAMDASAVGEYHQRYRRIMLSQKLLYEPVHEVFATVVHEQIHKLQHEMMLRLEFPSAHPLSLEERALSYYWIRERPKMVPGYSRSPAYRELGQEYHAFDTEETVVAALRRAFGR